MAAYTPAKLEMGRAVKQARLRKRLSIDRAALLLGTSRQHWIRWEKGQNMPGIYAEPLAELLELPLGLFEEEGRREPFRYGPSVSVGTVRDGVGAAESGERAA